MALKPLTFRQRDLAAALRAARQAGMSPSRVEIDRDGKLVLVFTYTAEPNVGASEWDDVVHT